MISKKFVINLILNLKYKVCLRFCEVFLYENIVYFIKRKIKIIILIYKLMKNVE